MRQFFQALQHYEPARDLAPQVMKRIAEHQIAASYRRLVLSTLTLGSAAFGLIGYRWYTFFELRDYSSVIQNILQHASHISESITLGYWVQGFRMVRESLPMVETTLGLVAVATLGFLFWKLVGFMRAPMFSDFSRIDRQF